MRRVIVLLAAAALGTTIGMTRSAFSATTRNAGNQFAAASSFCEAGTQTVTAAADAHVDQGNAGSNFGSATSLWVQSSAPLLVLPDNERTLVRFTLPSIPAYCALTGATLRLNASSASGGRTLQVLPASAAWSEGTVTWNAQPGTTGTAVTAASGTGWRGWNVTALVQAMYFGTNNGFLVRDASEGSLLAQTQVFSSREGANPPELVLTFG